MKKVIALLLTMSMFIACLSVFSLADGEETEFEPMTIQLGHINPDNDNDQYQKLAVEFANRVNEYTNGAVTIEICANSQLGGELDMLNGMILGTIDMGIITNGYFGTINPHSVINDLPFFFPSVECARDFVNSEVTDPIKDELYEMGYKVLTTGEAGMFQLMTQIPLTGVSDYKNMKVRVMEQENMLLTFEAFGANPTPMAFSECYTAVQQGVIEGMLLPVASFYSASYYEIFKYYTVANLIYNSINLTVSRKLWDTLSPELQEVMLRAADEAKDAQFAWMDEMNDFFFDEIDKSDCELVYDFPREEFVQAIEDEGVWDYFKTNYIGDELWDQAIEFVSQYE